VNKDVGGPNLVSKAPRALYSRLLALAGKAGANAHRQRAAPPVDAAHLREERSRSAPAGAADSQSTAAAADVSPLRRGSTPGSIVICTVSEMGAVRERQIDSAQSLAEALVQAMEGDADVRGAFRDVRALNGDIALTTHAHWLAQAQAGYLLCAACGRCACCSDCSDVSCLLRVKH